MNENIYERLGIVSDLKNEQKKFFNRIEVLLSKLDYKIKLTGSLILHSDFIDKLAFKLGRGRRNFISAYLNQNDFMQNVIVCQLLLEIMPSYAKELYYFLSDGIMEAFSLSLIDLGVKFKNGYFIKSGVKVLDNKLIFDTLVFLNKYKTGKKMFEEALRDLLKKDYEDAITKAFSAVESITKTILNNKKAFKNNKEELLKKLSLSQEWKTILLKYEEFANERSSRHGKEETHTKESNNPSEVEAYIYLAGIILRLIEQNI